jgi:hypothetical protein
MSSVRRPSVGVPRRTMPASPRSFPSRSFPSRPDLPRQPASSESKDRDVLMALYMGIEHLKKDLRAMDPQWFPMEAHQLHEWLKEDDSLSRVQDLLSRGEDLTSRGDDPLRVQLGGFPPDFIKRPIRGFFQRLVCQNKLIMIGVVLLLTFFFIASYQNNVRACYNRGLTKVTRTREGNVTSNVWKENIDCGRSVFQKHGYMEGCQHACVILQNIVPEIQRLPWSNTKKEDLCKICLHLVNRINWTNPQVYAEVSICVATLVCFLMYTCDTRPPTLALTDTDTGTGTNTNTNTNTGTGTNTGGRRPRGRLSQKRRPPHRRTRRRP